MQIGPHETLPSLAARIPEATGTAGPDPYPVTVRLRTPGDLLDTAVTRSGLLVEILATEGLLVAELDPDHHEPETVVRFLGHVERLLVEGLRRPGTPVAALPILDEDEWRRVVAEPNGTARAVPEATLVDLFEAVVARHPERRAVADARGALTYTRLASEARRLAQHLHAAGVRPEDRVGVLISRGDLCWVVACLGVLYAGAAWVPLDPDTPPARVAALLGRATVVTTITDRRLGGRLAGRATVDLDADAGLVATAPAAPLPVRVSGQHAAYVMHTSGSTGTPKGVVVTHAAVVNFVRAMARLFGLTPEDRLLQYASPGFDVWVQEVFTALLTGASVWVAGDEQRLSLEGLSRTLERERITVAELPPALMESMRPDRFPDLRIASVGGEAFPGSLAARWRPGRRVVNGYGPTEATIGVIYHDCPDDARSSPPIGRPVDNHRVYVLDGRLRPVPQGAVGELYLGGAGLARGYLGDPAGTAARFVADPYGAPGERLYRTGDLVRFDAAGNLVFVGRHDRQVKVHGQRVEPGETEAVLAGYPGVRRAVVDIAGDRLIGYVVADRRLDAALARRYLGERLPGYMVPGRIVQIAEIPVTANGKIDRAALAAASTVAPAAAPTAEPAGTEPSEAEPAGTEPAGAGAADGVGGTVRRLFEDCLHQALPTPAGDADFFALGGSSLQVIRLLNRVHQVFGVDVPVLPFLRRPTPAVLAELVAAQGPGRATAALPRAPHGAAVPLSAGQRGLWFLDRLITEPAAYHVLEAHRLRGPLDVPALRRALESLVRRHEMLRTRIEVHDGEPTLRVDPAGTLDWSQIDLPGAGEDQLREVLRELWRRPFDPTGGRLLRAGLIRLGSQEHVLCLVLHHLASDGRSTEVLFEELSLAYAQGDAALPEPVARYADFACWERERLDTGALAGQVAYWRERLAGLPAAIDLPLDRPSPSLPGHRGDSLRFDLDPETAARAREVSRQAGTTLFVTLLTCFVALLARYSRTRDVVVGTPVANRTHPQLDRVVGFVSTMVVLRQDCTGTPSFGELLDAVKDTALSAFAHQEVPFERLVEELEPERDLSRNPLFQVTFQSYPSPGQLLRLPGVTTQPVAVDAPASPFDLSMVVQQERDGRLSGCVTYRTDLFDRPTVARIAGHYRNLLAAGLRHLDRPLPRLDLLSAAERHALLETANATGTTPPLTINALVEGQVAARPHAVAVAHGDRRLTYVELDVAANRLAHLVRRYGADAQRPVGVCLERGPDLVVALLAVVKAGAAYVPIDPTYPRDRIRFMLADSGAGLVLTQRSLAGNLPPGSPRILLDEPPPELAAMPPDPPQFPPHPGDLAYIMYTSGSTGRPKGVAVPHQAVVRLVLGLGHLGIGATDTFLLLAPAAFDASTLEIWAPLGHGARLAVHPPGPVDPQGLGETLKAEGVTVLWLTAALTNLIADTVPTVLAPLRLLVTGGEALSAPHVRRLGEANPGLLIVNGYGPTETTTFATTHPVAAPTDATSVPIGRPIGGTRVYVLDPHLCPVPVGVPGELYIGGAGLARGYHGDAARTAERFVADPFGPPGGRLYRTGDLVRWTPDGVLQFIGRVDDQVKMRGFRIEPGEIVAVLNRHPAVRDSFVMPHGDGIATELVAYVATGEDPTILAAHLRQHLPPFMVPTAWVCMDALPLSATGKVDRRELLRRRAAVDGCGPVRHRPPRNGVEAEVASVWAEVLGRERVGVEDSFFAVGGNSLQATRLAARLARQFAVELSVVTVFQQPTVADLAAEIIRRRDDRRPADAVQADAVHPDVVHAAGQPAPLSPGQQVPLSPGQQALWFLDQLRPGWAAYNVPLVLRLTGNLDTGALRAALVRIVTRHEVLRSAFELGEDGRPVQRVREPQCFALREDDVSNLPLAQARRAAVRAAEADAAEPVPLTGPLLRASLVRVAAREHLLALTVHHAAFDGWSIGILYDELQAGYRGEPVAPLPAQYADLVRTHWTELDHRADLAYWRRRLAGLRPCTLPPDRPAPRRLSGRGERHGFPLLDAVAATRLAALGRERDATEFIVLLTGFLALLAARSGETDVSVGTPVSGREHLQAQRLIGFFANTVVLRADLSGDPTFVEALGRVRDAALAAYAHQGVPFETVVAELNPSRGRGNSPLFQVIFSVEDLRGRSLDLPAVDVETVEVHNGTAKFHLDLAVVRHDDGMSGTAEFSVDLYDRATITRLADDYRALLNAVLAQPGARLSAHVPPVRSAHVPPVRQESATGRNPYL